MKHRQTGFFISCFIFYLFFHQQYKTIHSNYRSSKKGNYQKTKVTPSYALFLWLNRYNFKLKLVAENLIFGKIAFESN